MVEQFVYDGREGQTRRDAVHVPGPGGSLRTARVLRVVNVATDPRHREAALAGTLHADEGLALPYVFHDPQGLHFALVVPESLAHTALLERAKLLERIAADTEHRVPAYVAEARVVIGGEGLRAYLEAPTARGAQEALDAREAQLAGREAQLADVQAREAALEEREARLQARAEVATRKEDELRTTSEQLEALGRDLRRQEEELETRFATLREREEALAAAPLTPLATDPAIDPAADVVMLDEPRAPLHSGEVALVDEAELHAVEDFGESSTSAELDAAPGEVWATPQEVRAWQREPEELGGDAARLEPEDVESEDLEPEDLEPEDLEPGDLEELSDDALDDGELLEGAELLDDESPEPTAIHRGEQAPVHPAPRQSVAPPDDAFDDPQVEMLARLGSDGVWLHARLGEGFEDAFRDESTDLLVQYVAVDDYPVVLLTLVDEREPRPYTRRAALDPKDAEDRAILEALRDRFRVTVGLFSPEGRFERTRELEAPERRTNLTMILERAARADGQIDPLTALERALAAPPPVQLRGHPFEDAPLAADAKEALAAVQALAKWSSPAKLDLALLALSIPRQRVDDAFRRILGDGLRHGIAFPPALVSRAISLGIAPEPGELVIGLVDAFRGTSALPDRGGLTAEVTARNWEQLLGLAGELEVAIASEAHDAAWESIRSVRGDSAAPKMVAPEALREMSADEVADFLMHPKLRLPAALELARRGEPAYVATIFDAVRKMPREEVLDVVPRLVAFGEEAADALIDGLNARKTFVRQAAALALGELKLRRAVAPLVHLLQTEPSEIWWEVGRVLASFGAAGLRPMQRAMRDPKGAEERFSYTLAHLSALEPAKVRELESDANPKVKAVAVAAMTQKLLAEQHLAALTSGDEEDGIHAFSRRFYAALGGS